MFRFTFHHHRSFSSHLKLICSPERNVVLDFIMRKKFTTKLLNCNSALIFYIY